MRTLLVLPALLLALLASASSAAVAANTADVHVDNFSFSPDTLTVSTGTVVTWTNHDDIPHTVVSDAAPPVFKSPPLDTDQAFSYTFSKPGTYRYFCSIHPHMVGTVIVK
jgi:plastocyanin